MPEVATHARNERWRIDARGAYDGRGLSISPASAVVRLERAANWGNWTHAECTVEVVGSPEEVDRLGPVDRVIRRPRAILTPGHVNAHTHLDLTEIGPRSAGDGAFLSFVDVVRRERPVDEVAIRAAVRRGIELSLAGGVTAVGDIAGAARGRPTLAPWRELEDSPIAGVSFVEFFAIGAGEEPGLARVIETALRARGGAYEPAVTGRVAMGLQPHAPTTVSRRVFEWVAEHSPAPCATHLAETPDEREFIAHGRGPQRGFLEALGLWDDGVLREIGRGATPVAHLAAALSRRPFVAAHVNDASDADLALLASTRASVAYCPRASEYFGAARHFGPHRYAEMLRAGINVCLGTDSIINLPEGTDRLSVWDEARRLFQRDGTSAVTLLEMVTWRGAAALGLDPARFALTPGRVISGLVAIDTAGEPGDPLAAALRSTGAPELLVAGK